MNLDNNAALLLIDVQKAFYHESWGIRNNLKAENNIAILLEKFRDQKRHIIHVQHISKKSDSLFRSNQPGAEFMEFVCPKSGEEIFQKNVNSAFIGTGISEFLQSKKINQLVMVGFTSDHCVSTSARMASNLGFEVFIVADATATFNRIMNGINYKAEMVHEVNLASLSDEFAAILTMDDLK